MLLNGREIILHGAEEPYPLVSETRYRQDLFTREAVCGETETTPVSDLFFSDRNIEYLQQGIRYLVHTKSARSHVIDRQSDLDLLVIMQGIFKEQARHLPYDVIGQVKRLNAAVLNYAVPRIITEIESYLKYRYDVTTMPAPLPRSMNMSSKGERTLELRRL